MKASLTSALDQFRRRASPRVRPGRSDARSATWPTAIGRRPCPSQARRKVEPYGAEKTGGWYVAFRRLLVRIGVPALLLLPAGCSFGPASNPTDALINSQAGQARIQLFQSRWSAANANPIDYFGRVVDQYGEPVVGATVAGNVMLIAGYDNTPYEHHATTTDNNGLFQFAGLHGVNIGIVISKVGYEIGGHGEGFKGPASGLQSTPTDRAVFTMWKLRGAEPMVHWPRVSAKLPCDGTDWPHIFEPPRVLVWELVLG